MVRMMRAVGLALSWSLLAGCGGSDEPAVEAWAAGAWTPMAVTEYSIDGKRDGRSTTATAIFTLQDQRRLRVTMVITYDPQPVLRGGNWHIDGDDPATGAVVERAMKFFGGQGEGPSLGGGFQLDQDGDPRFRIHVPLRPVSTPDWGDIQAE
ncbi:MAG: hypothetical protein HN712_18970 [Gemmatimonadetes bacterium]|nr:hypothetical protein [Gemmatimonadota bacterium]MBT6147281.1 hypothetical protein [Gemmatimonadota bacterium]MBT7862406.1 hypothetical protein [Gemmatimonadota bacterium]